MANTCDYNLFLERKPIAHVRRMWLEQNLTKMS